MPQRRKAPYSKRTYRGRHQQADGGNRLNLRAGVLTVSEGCSRGEREDTAGPEAMALLVAAGFVAEVTAIVPDDVERISGTLAEWSARCDLILTTGGTGFSPSDVTPEATARVIEREAPGLAELLRWEGYRTLPRAVLSRGIAGIRGAALIVNLPGSRSGVREGVNVLLPLLPHALALLQGEPVDHTPESGSRHAANSQAGAQADAPPQTVTLIETNLDDFNPELYESVMEQLLGAGAVDVYLSAIQMKKNRPAVRLSVLVAPERMSPVVDLIFRHTTTFGVRTSIMSRITLNRRWETVSTEYGPIRVKVGMWQGEETAASPEYEEVKAMAAKRGVPLKRVYEAAQRAYAALRNAGEQSAQPGGGTAA